MLSCKIKGEADHALSWLQQEPGGFEVVGDLGWFVAKRPISEEIKGEAEHALSTLQQELMDAGRKRIVCGVERSDRKNS